jgi:hypothetical protein
MSRWFLALLITVGAPLAVRANDGSSVEVGSAVNFSKNKQIRMVSENVRIYMYDDQHHVTVDFTFKNTGAKTAVMMGFPDRGGNISAAHSIIRFKSWVDGKPVKVQYKKLTQPKDTNPEETHEGLWTKWVQFGAKQTRRVRVDYEAVNWYTGGTISGATYILTTGATWHGKISSTRITVNWSHIREFQHPTLTFTRASSGHEYVKPWKRTGMTSRTIEFGHYVPDFDLDVTMCKGFWRFMVNDVINSAPCLEYVLPFPSGDSRDLLIHTGQLGDLFAGFGPGGCVPWTNPACKWFGGEIEINDDGTALLGGRRTVKLHRPVVWKRAEADEAPEAYVYLKDVIEAAGGSYKYDPVEDRVNIKFPR